MKRKTQPVKIKTRQEIEAENKENRLRSLIDAALDRWEPEELLKMFLDRIPSGNEELQAIMADNIEDELLKERAAKLYDIDEIRDMLNVSQGGGGLLLTGLNLAQEMQIEEFIQAKIFPYYNQQQNMLFC